MTVFEGGGECEIATLCKFWARLARSTPVRTSVNSFLTR